MATTNFKNGRWRPRISRRKLQPKPEKMVEEGEPRMARWDDPSQNRMTDARKILKSSKMDGFEWRPYTKAVENWEFPLFYPEKTMLVRVESSLDDEFISFARCIKVCELVGIDCVEHYFPNRVASQFGLLQDVPCHVKRNNLSKEKAWNEYNKPIDDLTLYIPSRSTTPRFTPTFCEWRRKSLPEFRVVESAESLLPSNIIGDDGTSDFVALGSKRGRYTKPRHEETESDIASDIDEEDDKLNIPQMTRLVKKKKCSRGDGSELPDFVEATDIVASPPETRQTCDDELDLDGSNADMIGDRSKELMCLLLEDGAKAGEKAGSDETCTEAEKEDGADELNIHIATGDGTQGQAQFLSDDGIGSEETIKSNKDLEKRNDGDIAGKKARSDEKEDDAGKLIQQNIAELELAFKADNNESTPCQKLASEGANGVDAGISIQLAVEEEASKAENNESSPCQKLASGGPNGVEIAEPKGVALSPSDELNIHFAISDGTQRQDQCLQDDGIGSEETKKSNEDLETRNDDSGEGDAGNDSNEKWIQDLEKRILKAKNDIERLIERRAMKQRKLAARRAMKRIKVKATRLN